MYITKIILRNIRCFRDFKMEFEKGQRSALLVGDNGEGKSTLLRSIAMGLCDESSAAALFRELPGKLVKRKRENEGGRIEIHLRDGGKDKGIYVIKTFISPLGRLERLNQELRRGVAKPRPIKPEKFPWKRIFVAGYGAGARTLGSGSLDSYRAVDAVYTLFRYDEPLQNPELALRKLVDEGEKRNRKKSKGKQKDMLETFLDLLASVLSLREHDRVDLTKRGIEVRGPWGQCQLDTLGDGYRSVITWVLDLMGRRLLFGRTLDPKLMTGIVLLDEVEQHLHPRWQLKAMPLVMKAFPKIQFIATTHSPLVVSGCRGCRIRKVTSDHDETSEPYGWRPQDVYRNVMDLQQLRAIEVEEQLDRYQRLELRRLTGRVSEKNVTEMRGLKRKLDKTLHGSDPAVLSVNLSNLRRYLKNQKG